MERLAVNGLAMTHVAAEPGTTARPPLLCIHGFLGGAWYFENYQRFFAARGYPSYALDLRGHHGSRPVNDIGGVSLMDYVADTTEAAQWVTGRHRQPPIIIGHSMGGLLGMKVAEADSGLASGLVLLCAAPPRGIPLFSFRLATRQAKYLGALLRSRPLSATYDDGVALNFNRTPEADRAAMVERLVPESGRAGREISLGALRVDAGRIRCAVLSVSAAEDHFVPPSVGRALARKFSAPWMLFPAHAHMILTEPGWEKPAAVVEGWMREQR